MKTCEKRCKYIKLCLISPALEIISNIIYLISFFTIFTYIWQNGKYYNDNQILRFTESYISYKNFNDINSPSEFEQYISNLINKIFTINTNDEKLPIFLPLNQIRLSLFSNKECEEELFNYSCNKNFTCTIDFLIKSFKSQCGAKYYKSMEIDPKNLNEKRKNKMFLEDLVKLFSGYYSEYDLLNGGTIIDLTMTNYNENTLKIKNLIFDKNLKLISLQINLKVPSNNNYVDVFLGLEMNRYFDDIKKIISIDVYNSYRPSTNMFLFSIYIFYFISTIINVIKLIYEMVVKIVWSTHLFSFINEIFDLLLVIFSIFYIIVDQSLSLEMNLNKFESHLIYSTIRKNMKLIVVFVLISIPLRLISLISWWKWVSYPFIKVLKVIFRMLPGVIISFIISFIFLFIFVITNYLFFQDIFSEYQTFYYSFLNIFNFNIIYNLYDIKNNAIIFHNLTFSKYIFIFVLIQYFFILFSISISLSILTYLFKKATLIESPKEENEYINKLIAIKQKLRENLSENIDLFGMKKQVLFLKLINGGSSFSDTNKYELILFKNSNQVISFLKYLFALKPELQFKNLIKKLNIVVEVNNHDNLNLENEWFQINNLADWMTFVGCKILLIIYCQTNFSLNFQMKLYNTYNLIKFINDINELEKIINENDYGILNIDNNAMFTINSIKNNILQNQ